MKKLIVRLDLLKAHVKGYTRKDGTFVAEHDDKRPSAVKGALYDKDDSALGPHKVGDTVSYKGERGTRTGKVKGARDGKVVVEHKAGYTELKHHSELSPAAMKKVAPKFQEGDTLTSSPA